MASSESSGSPASSPRSKSNGPSVTSKQSSRSKSSRRSSRRSETGSAVSSRSSHPSRKSRASTGSARSATPSSRKSDRSRARSASTSSRKSSRSGGGSAGSARALEDVEADASPLAAEVHDEETANNAQQPQQEEVPPIESRPLYSFTPPDPPRKRKVKVIPFAELNTLPKPHRAKPLRPIGVPGELGLLSPGPVYDYTGPRVGGSSSQSFTRPGYSFGRSDRASKAKPQKSTGFLFIETKWRTKPVSFSTAPRNTLKLLGVDNSGDLSGPGAYDTLTAYKSVERRLTGGLMAGRLPPERPQGDDTNFMSTVTADVKALHAKAFAQPQLKFDAPKRAYFDPSGPPPPSTFGNATRRDVFATKIASDSPGPGYYITDHGERLTRRSKTRGAAVDKSRNRIGTMFDGVSGSGNVAGPATYAPNWKATKPTERSAIAYLTS